MKTKYFRYIGKPTLTRGQYGENLTDGYEVDYDGYIHFYDSEIGDVVWGTIEWGIESKRWILTSGKLKKKR